MSANTVTALRALQRKLLKLSHPPRFGYRAHMDVAEIEVVEDFSSTAKCDEGFLRLRRLRCRNRRADGTVSATYRVDVVDRPTLDAVCVLIYRRSARGLEILLRKNLRPAAYFRKGKPGAELAPLSVEELVAGVLEAGEAGEEGIKARAAAETLEEAGIEVSPHEVQSLGAPFFVAPGIISEMIFPTAVDVTGKVESSPRGDGSPLEEGASLRWWPARELAQACRKGDVADAKTEISLGRLLAQLDAK
jgi:ADP-ribose pyrophosphatase